LVPLVRTQFDAQRDFVIVEGRPEWHVGVVGIVASRVLQEFHRPTVIFGGDGQFLRGSGRSIEGFDLAAALRDCNELLIKHGGHALAAGASIHSEKIVCFRERLNTLARASLRPEHLQPGLKLDAEVTWDELALEQVEELDRLAPMGQANPTVRLAARGLCHQAPPRRMGRHNQHIKLFLTDGRQTLEAVWWNAGNASLPENRFDIAFTPQINEYNGRRTVQLKLLDWRPSVNTAIPSPPP